MLLVESIDGELSVCSACLVGYVNPFGYLLLTRVFVDFTGWQEEEGRGAEVKPWASFSAAIQRWRPLPPHSFLGREAPRAPFSSPTPIFMALPQHHPVPTLL